MNKDALFYIGQGMKKVKEQFNKKQVQQSQTDVAIRIERTIASGSAYAKDMMCRVALPVLKELNYIP